MQKKLAILTAAYNRVRETEQLYVSLKNQSDNDFHWYLINDGSKEDYTELVERIKTENLIEFTYIIKENGGKHTAINVGVKEVAEPLTAIVDNDDTLVETAVAEIVACSSRVLNDNKISAMTFLKGKKEDGAAIGKTFTQDFFVGNFIEERINNKVCGDKFEIYKTDILKQFPFFEIEGEKFVSEAVVWIEIAKQYDMLFINKVLYLCEYRNDGLSASNRKLSINNPVGATAVYNQFMSKAIKFTVAAKNCLMYVAHCKFAKYGIKKTISNSNRKFLTVILYPFGIAVYALLKRGVL